MEKFYIFCPLSIDWGNVAQWVSGLAAIFVVLVALFRDDIQRCFQKHKLKFLNVINNLQDTTRIYRLVIKNDSPYIAKNVEFDIEEVKVNGKTRDNFLPAPLSWTHHRPSVRDIFPHQTAYLDIVKIEPITSPPKIYAPNIFGIQEMVTITKGTTILRLKYYTENGQTGKINLKVTWSGNQDNLPIIEITD